MIRLLKAIASALLLSATAVSANEGKPPNILLILADDLGYGGLGCYGQKLILTPQIDKMAAEGMRFTDFYCASPACVPSRVAMLLGMHPGHAPIRDNQLPHLPDFKGYMKAYPDGLWPPKTPTLGKVMKAAGYKTAQFGKLEAGIPMAKGKMTEHGLDEWFGFKGTGAALAVAPPPVLTDGISLVPTLVGQPDRRLNHLPPDKLIFDQVKNGIVR